MKTAEQLRNEIQAINIKLAQGVPDDKAHVLMMDKSELEEELKALEEALPEQEEVVVAVQTFDLEAIMEEDGTPLYALVEDETAREIIKLKFQSVFNGLIKSHNLEIIDLINRHKVDVDSYQERELQTTRQNGELQRKADIFQSENKSHLVEIGRLQESLESTTDDLRDANNRNAEIEQNRQNAVRQLEEEQEQHQVTKSELDRLKNGQKLTDEEEKAKAELLARTWKDKLIRVINIRQKDEINSKILIAERADTLETVEREAIYFYGKYIKATDEEVQQIREEYERNHVTPPAIEEIAEETFQEESSTEGALPPNESEDSREQREAIEVEPETWEQSVERRLTALELKANKYEPEFIHDIAS